MDNIDNFKIQSDLVVFRCTLCNTVTNHLYHCDKDWVCISCMNEKNLHPSIGCYIDIDKNN